jgi:FG-GAP repeat
MVNRARAISAVCGLALLGTTACNWTTFDDLNDEVWVDRVDKPNGSRLYGLAIGAMPVITGAPASDGAKLVVLGRAKSAIATLQYNADGTRSATSADASGLFGQFAIQFDTFADHPAFAASPTEGVVAFGAITGNAEAGDAMVGTLNGLNLAIPAGPPTALSTGDARAKMRPSGMKFATLLGDQGGFVNDDTISDVVLARGSQLDLALDYSLGRARAMWPECTQPATTVMIGGVNKRIDTALDVGVADIEGDAAPEVIVGMGISDKSLHSEVRVFPLTSVALAGQSVDAPGPCGAFATLDFDGASDAGFAIATAKFDPAASKSDYAYGVPSTSSVFVHIAGEATPVHLFQTVDTAGFGYALAIGDLDGDMIPELVVGAPRSDVDGVTDAGSVYIYQYNLASKNFAQVGPAITTSSPSASEMFGTSLAIAPWGPSGHNVLVVGAEGKVFTYFRLPDLYDDVRTGR